MSNKIIRTICYFTNNLTQQTADKLEQVAQTISEKEFVIQTKRICSPISIKDIENRIKDRSILLGVGALDFSRAQEELENFYSTQNVFFNLDLSSEKIHDGHIKLLLDILQKHPSKTFNFAYTFNNMSSSPYFPSSSYTTDGFSIGLQPTDLSEDCASLEEWFAKLNSTWLEIKEIFKQNGDFLGIDSSIAPIYEGKGSLVNFIKRLGLTFTQSVTTDTYLLISKFIKDSNPCPIGLCGLMFPCLEDFELAKEYDNGNFPIERNLFLSLHSGLGIDTYPIGIDENPNRIKEILLLLQGLSNKYKKALSVRFVSDGKTKIGQMSDFQNQFLKDVIIRKL